MLLQKLHEAPSLKLLLLHPPLPLLPPLLPLPLWSKLLRSHQWIQGPPQCRCGQRSCCNLCTNIACMLCGVKLGRVEGCQIFKYRFWDSLLSSHPHAFLTLSAPSFLSPPPTPIISLCPSFFRNYLLNNRFCTGYVFRPRLPELCAWQSTGCGSQRWTNS